MQNTEVSENSEPTGAGRSLRAVYVAGGTSVFGTQMTLLALPWLVLESSGSATRTGLVFAVQVLPMALLGLVGSEAIHRLGARRTMVVADAARAVAIGLVPALSAAGLLGLGALLAIVAAVGVLGVPYFAAQRLLATELTGPDPRRLTRTNSVLEGGFNFAMFAGPAAAGVLIALIGAAQVLWFDAASYAFSCLLLSLFVPRGAGSSQPAAAIRPGILAGLRALRDDDFMRPVMISTIAFGFLLRILTLSLPLLAFERFGRDARVGGLLVAGFGAGALIGSFISYLIANRLSPARLMGLSVVQLVLPLWVLATPAPVALLVVALAVAAAGLPLNNAPFFSILATRFPDEVRTKVVQSVVTLSNIAGPLGYLAGGLAMQSLGVTPTLFAVAALCSLAAANLLRVIRRLERPAERAGPADLVERQPSHA